MKRFAFSSFYLLRGDLNHSYYESALINGVIENDA